MPIRPGDPDVRSTMEPLRRLDISECHTVSGLVEGMRCCSFGARMLGNVAATLTNWFGESPRPVIVYDGPEDTPLYGLLAEWKYRWVSAVQPSWELSLPPTKAERLIIVGEYAERQAAAIRERATEVIFINRSGQASPGHYRDGHFPNLVPSDPAFVIPVLDAVAYLITSGRGRPGAPSASPSTVGTTW